MAPKLTPFQPPYAITSTLFRGTPDGGVPAYQDLQELCVQLAKAKQAALDRAQKAEEGLKTIDESYRRLSEKEKGKFKAVEKIKRERDFTPLPDGDDSRSSSAYPSGSKPRNNLHTSNGLASSSARSSVDPRRSAVEDLKKKKKKRKREGGDSDVELEFQRPRKMSPAVIPTSSHPLPQKLPKPSIPLPVTNTKTTSGPDFSVPASQQLLPPRPPIPPPPIPGPSKPVEVTEDFSKAKQPAQILVSTFYSSVEPYLRNIKEEDVGFLEYTADEVEPFVMPKLGRHYLEVWEDQDQGLLPPQPILLEPQIAPSSYFEAPTPKWDPSTLSDPDLAGEEKGHGPLTERVISALLPIQDSSAWRGVKAAEDAMEGRPGGSGAAAARRERLNVTDLEARIRDTMRYHGLLNTPPNYLDKVDDPIATALREAQRELRHVVATNKARKARLAAIARDRLGYQEYLELRDSIDKNITTLYTKLQKKDTPKLSKKKKKPLQGAAAAAAAAAAANAARNGSVAPEDGNTPISALAPCPAALGLSPDEENHLSVNEQLKQLVETRRQWVDTVGAIFEQKERENPGRIYGLPKESVYKGVEEEVNEVLKAVWEREREVPNHSALSGVGCSNSNQPQVNGILRNGGGKGHAGGLSNGSLKGKEKARGDAMDIG